VSEASRSPKEARLILMDCLKCQICGEKLTFNPYCPCSLGEHLIKKHPELRMTHFSIENTTTCSCCTCVEETNNKFKGPASAKMGGCPPKRGKPPDNKGGVYKTTVETWRPGPLKVTCPVCNQEDRPCIRKQRNKVAYSSLGALCMLSCWPLCFLPFLMPGGSKIQLYCKHCGTYLGEYNRKTGQLTTCCTDRNKKLKVPSDLC
ncbi:hypothetical protein NQ318_012153, partial [Aromia moschata]